MKRQYLIALILAIYICGVSAGFRKKHEEEDESLDVPQAHPLVEMIGKEMYGAVNRPKYKFYIYMTVGTLPDEKSTIALISTICNVLYGFFIWMGFIFFRRDYMLLITLLTLYVGPAIVLVLIGALGLSIAAFALYPVWSVVCLWTWYFLTSQVAQVIGRHLGMDSDMDGDVDFLDFVHWAADTKVGKFLGLQSVYNLLNDMTRDPFQEINMRLDAISRAISKEDVTSSSDKYSTPPRSTTNAIAEHHT